MNLFAFLARRSQPRRFIVCCNASGQRWEIAARTYDQLLSGLIRNVYGLTFVPRLQRLAHDAWAKGRAGQWGEVLTILEVR